MTESNYESLKIRNQRLTNNESDEIYIDFGDSMIPILRFQTYFKVEHIADSMRVVHQ